MEDKEHQLTFATARAADPQRFRESQLSGARATQAYWRQPKRPAWLLDMDAQQFETWLKQQEANKRTP